MAAAVVPAEVAVVALVLSEVTEVVEADVVVAEEVALVVEVPAPLPRQPLVNLS